MTITAEHFAQRVGRPPEQDDLERCNCSKAGEPGHTQCGWDTGFDLPIFLVGRDPDQREHFLEFLWDRYQKKS